MAELSASAAGTIRLGDISVNRLGLGTNRISNSDASRQLLIRAIGLGVNFIDTAHRYGQSEEVIGQTLAPYPRGVVVTTKGGWAEDNSVMTLQSNIDQSLRLLKLDSINLWQLHRVDPTVSIKQTMEILKTQQQAGKIKNIGLSGVSVEQIEAAREVVPIVSVQNNYNLLNRQHEDVLQYCTDRNIIFIPFYPLASGSVAQDAYVAKLAANHHATPYQIALAWLLRHSPMMLPIPGTLSIEHLESNVAAAGIKLSDDDYQQLCDLHSPIVTTDPSS